MDYDRDLPEEIGSIIEEGISASEPSLSSFTALINSVDLFSISRDLADRVGVVLKNGRYRLRDIKSHQELLVVLLGLARVAAVSRNTSLADEIRILVRRYRHDPQFALSTDDALRIVLFAAGAFADVLAWSSFVGDNLKEIAFSELSGEDATMLQSQIQVLCRAVPELWIAVGRAEAALASLGAAMPGTREG